MNGHVEDQEALKKIAKTFLKDCQDKEEIVLVCIGTDRSVGDSLGPLVGEMLKKYTFTNVFVYGNLEQPVHATNLVDTLKHIEKRHKDAFVIAVDACLGRIRSVEFITYEKEPLKPGAGVKKELPEVGDVSFKGIVNVSGYMELLVLQNTRLYVVMKVANAIMDCLLLGLREREKKYSKQKKSLLQFL